MKQEEFNLKSKDGFDLHIYSWLPEVERQLKGVIHVIHGMAEHAMRYSETAAFFNQKGYAVYAMDLRGHGGSLGKKGIKGFIEGKNSWKTIIEDIFLFDRYLKSKFPEMKHIMLGHSMGSFYLRAYMSLFAERKSLMVFSGTAQQNSLLLNAGLMIAMLQCLFIGRKKPSHLLNFLSFGTFNKNFKPVKTPFDWLSRNEEVCLKYHRDELCGFVCTTSFFRELFRLIRFIQSKDVYPDTDKNLPVLIFSGSEDAVGNFGKGPEHFSRILADKGFKNITKKLYPGGRHEMLNETNANEVMEDILNWIELYEQPSSQSFDF